MSLVADLQDAERAIRYARVNLREVWKRIPHNDASGTRLILQATDQILLNGLSIFKEGDAIGVDGQTKVRPSWKTQ